MLMAPRFTHRRGLQRRACFLDADNFFIAIIVIGQHPPGPLHRRHSGWHYKQRGCPRDSTSITGCDL